MMFIRCPNLTGDIYAHFQTSHFADFEQFKVDSYFANFGQVKLTLFVLYDFVQVTVILLSLGKTSLKDDSNPLRLIKIQDPCT